MIRRPGIRFGVPESVLEIAIGQRCEDLASQLECDESTVWRTCQRYRQSGLVGLLSDHRHDHSGRDLEITPVQRAQIVELACWEPVAKGLHITHWSSDDLAVKWWRMGLWLTSVRGPCGRS